MDEIAEVEQGDGETLVAVAPAPRPRRGIVGLVQNVVMLVMLVLLVAMILGVVRIPIRMAKRKNHADLERIKAFAYFGIVFPPLWVMAFVMASGGGGRRNVEAVDVTPDPELP